MPATKRLVTIGLAGLMSLGLLAHAGAQETYTEALDRRVERRQKPPKPQLPSWCYRADGSIYMGYFQPADCSPSTRQWQHVATSTERWLAARDMESIFIPNVAIAFNAFEPHDSDATLRKAYYYWLEWALDPEAAKAKEKCKALDKDYERHAAERACGIRPEDARRQAPVVEGGPAQAGGTGASTGRSR